MTFAIAIVLSTGNPGHVFAAAFEATTDAIDLFPFLMRRCGENMDKRVYNLHDSIGDKELRNDFVVALQAYAPRLIFKPSFLVQTGFSGIMGMWRLRLPLFGEISLK